jgi:hypothetical protein
MDYQLDTRFRETMDTDDDIDASTLPYPTLPYLYY